MKKITSILLAGLTMLSLGVTSCMNDFDTPVTGNAYGNNSIDEQQTISIANLKAKYASVVSSNGLQQITEETRIEGVVVADDESGNIYKQLVIRDETGAIVVGINTTGIYAGCPVGQKVVIDCQGLYIGGYGEQAQLGSTYTGAIGRMELSMWLKHVRIINRPQLWYEELKPIEFNAAVLKSQNKDEAPFLVTFRNVTIREANGEAIFAPDAEKDGGNGVTRKIVLDDGTTLDLRTSAYANFSTEIIPQGPIDVTGILSRYRSNWQLVARTYNDIKRK